MTTRNKSSIIKVVLTVAVLFATTTACKKDYWDINKDPNHAADVPVNLLLPSAQAAIAHTLGNDMFQIGGMWAQYYTQSSFANQYNQYEQYSPTALDFDYIWGILYSDALADLKIIDVKAAETGQTQYIACSKILQAYAFQLLTDNFGDIPFSEALRAEEGILEPHYDSQQSVYVGILGLLDAGLALIDDNVTTTTPGAPGTNDILFNGQMSMWRKFANTLKLRCYLRLTYAPGSPIDITAGIAGLNGQPMLGAGEMVQVNYSNAGGNTNPFYSQIVDLGFTSNLIASLTTINYFQTNLDPRIDAFYVPTPTGHVGTTQGDFNAGLESSTPSPITGAAVEDVTSALAPVILMSSYESMFLQAEAMARGLLTGTAQSMYEAGIRENFTHYGIADTSATTYIAQPSIAYPSAGTVEDQVKAIITQKWAAMCGNQTNEAWVESRRTNYPDFFAVSVSAIYTGMPSRYLYPQSEITANGNHAPQVANVIAKVWWDGN